MLRTFARGLPGIALVVLRSSLAVMVVRLGTDSELFRPFGFVAALITLNALFLFAGLLTRLVALFCGAAALTSWLFAAHGHIQYAALLSAFSFCVAGLGPGSYSVDALWFGLPKRIFPPE